jgi:hypothetical protein
MPKPFLILDDSMTMHGVRFSMEGGRWERFNKNPVMLFMHVRGKVIGKWVKVRFESGAWWADPVFDIKDEEAKEIARKVEEGFLNASSVGVQIHAAEVINNEVVITDWEPYENSIVDAGSNLNALQLYTNTGEMIADSETYIKNLTLSIMSKETKTAEEAAKEIVKEVFPKSIVLALGVAEDADNAAVSKAITDLIAKNLSLELQLKSSETDRVKTLVDAAFAAHKISDSDREHYLKLGAHDFETVKAILDGIEAPKKLSEFVSNGAKKDSSTITKEDQEEYDKLFREGALTTLKAENPEKFKRLFKAFYGQDPEE